MAKATEIILLIEISKNENPQNLLLTSFKRIKGAEECVHAIYNTGFN